MGDTAASFPPAPTVAAGDLVLTPLRVQDAAEMADVLADPALYAFTGGEPPDVADLHRRYTAQTVGGSADGTQAWLNWIVRERASGRALGFVQATVVGDTADVAWVVGTAHQGRGVARTAAVAMVDWLTGHAVTTVVADVHPDHLASTAVARHLGLVASGRLVDGEVEWRRPADAPRVTIRPAGADDLPRLLPFWAVAAEDAHRPPDHDDAIHRLVTRDAEALQLATVGDVLVGTVIAGWDGWRCHLHRLAVHPSWRRRGIARLLVDAAEERFVALGASRVDAMVLDDNPDAHALWARLGYSRQVEWSRWVTPLSPPRARRSRGG